MYRRETVEATVALHARDLCRLSASESQSEDLLRDRRRQRTGL